MLLVTGATGKVGRHLVGILRREGAPVRVLVRDPSRAADLGGIGAEVAQGDLYDARSLERAMAGVDRMFLLAPPDERQNEMHENAIDAARRAGVRHVVKLSVVDADDRSGNPLLRWHGESDAYLRATGMDWTLIRPQSFMHNVLGFIPSIVGEGRLYAPDTGHVPLVHPRDVASVAARALTDDRHAGRTYDVTGPQLLTWGDAAASLARALGREVAWIEVPPDAARQAMLGMQMPGWLVESLLQLYATGARGEHEQLSPVVRDVGGVEPTTYDEFAREVAPVIQAAASGPAQR